MEMEHYVTDHASAASYYLLKAAADAAGTELSSPYAAVERAYGTRAAVPPADSIDEGVMLPLAYRAIELTEQDPPLPLREWLEAAGRLANGAADRKPEAQPIRDLYLSGDETELEALRERIQARDQAA